MIEIVTGRRPGESKLLEQAFRLRHTVFVEEMNWHNLRRPDGREIDQFDLPGSVHHLAMRAGRVIGYQRFNATLGPHLLSDVHSFLCARPYPRAPHVWEWTRYCVDRTVRGKDGAGNAASELMIAALEWAHAVGVYEFVLEFDPMWITRFLDIGYDVRPLGLPQMIEGEPVVAVHMRSSHETLKKIRQQRGIRGSVLSTASRRELDHSAKRLQMFS